MNDRDLWLTVRRALLLICAAIAKRYGIEEKETPADARRTG